MIEGFYELFSIILGRYFFGLIGASLRYAWMRLSQKEVSFAEVWESPGDDREIDREGFKNRIVGFVFVLVLILLFIV